MAEIIGREQERRELLERYNSGRSEFIAVYGRRRVGKTFLIRETLAGKITFQHTGLNAYEGEKPTTTADQLRHFHHQLISYGAEEAQAPTDWMEAFYMLERLLQKLDNGERQVVFIDELPWLDTHGSGFLTAFEAFWNGWADGRNIMLVVCGSAASWIIKNLVMNTRGLYGRLTWEIKLAPFTIRETELMLQHQGVNMNRYDIAQLYMALGGIPYYLGYVQRNLSLSQNIDKIFFARNSRLRLEFDRLFKSQFKHYDDLEQIVRFLSTKRCGYTRTEIAKALGRSEGGAFSGKLRTLEESDFITSYRPFDARKYETLYRLSDPFCRFYLAFVDRQKPSPSFWTDNQMSQRIAAWRGIAFEDLCMLHIHQIKKALECAAVASEQSSWTLRNDENHDGAQMDLIISRADNVVNLCEMKFYSTEISISKEEDRKMRNRIALLMENILRRQSVQPVLITTFGLKEGMYSSSFVRTVTLDDLFL
ncbi:MAG: ATP-binding protein [Bacteroidales bacterium]|nr:ATP-binding protein [Bacteroidales bacterium]